MKTDWKKIKKEYIDSNGDVILKEFAQKHNVKYSTLRSRKNREKWDNNIKDNGATLNATQHKKTNSVATEKNILDIEDSNIRTKTTKGRKQTSKTNLINKVGPPIGSKNAIGNKGGLGAPEGNKFAETHGFFSKYLPEETLELTQEIIRKPYIDILWENITIQYAAIIRAQRIMYVKDQEDTTEIIKKERRQQSEFGDTSDIEYIHHMSWDKQATFLQAQSRAMGELRSMIKQYDELVDNNLATEEQELRIKKLKADITRVEGNEDAIDKLDGLIEAIDNEAKS